MKNENCPLEKDDITVNEDNASRGIYVTGFPSNTTASELVIHFLKRKHGGGDIECIHITENRAAVIIFDDPSVATSVVKEEHYLSRNGNGRDDRNDVPLNVRPLSEMEIANTPEIFRRVSAWIHNEVFRNYTHEEIKHVISKVRDETEIEFHDVSEDFVLSGKFQQVKQSQDFLSHYLKDFQNSDLRSSTSDDSDKKGRSVKHSAKRSSLTSCGAEKLENEWEASAVNCSGEPEGWNKDWTGKGDDDSDGDDPLEHKLGLVKLSVMKGDITDQQVDAIVNAANIRLDHGAGVTGAVIKKGDYGIQEESDNYIRQHGLLKGGEVVMTGAVANSLLKKEQILSPDGVPPTITPLRRPQLQVQSGIEQMRQALDDDKRTRDVRKQKLQKEKLLFSTLENALGEEQQKRARLEEELSRVKNAGNERARTLENQLRDTSRMCELKKAEVREKVAAVNNLQVLLEENQQEKSGIKNQLSQQQKVCTKLEERLQAEQVSSQSLQLQLEANELIIRELQLKVGQGREQRTALEQTVRRLQLQFTEEKDRHASIERDLQLALSTSQAEVSELLRSGTRDWILLREEITLGRKVLGKGAWGIVNEGMFRGCKVAVKKIHDLILSDHNRRSFEREMNIASRCRHPNLLQFIGATNDDGSPLFVTELLDTCLRRLLSERELTPKEVLNLTLDIAKGLNYLHLNKPLPIIHRDISSANVLLWRRGECWRAKLSDYGAANFMRRCMTVNKGAIIYSAPEAFTPRQSPKVDVYSFGVLLCEMCIREQPDPQDLPDQIKRVSDDTFREFIQRCVEKGPEKRPTMAEVIPALEQC